MKTILFIFFLLLPYFHIIPQELNSIIQGNINLSFNGTFQNATKDFTVYSDDGNYSGTYEVASATDEMRQLKNFKLFYKENLIHTFSDVPGSDMYISNNGTVIFLDHSNHFKGELKINVYNQRGIYKFSKIFKSASLFGSSPLGNFIGINDKEGLNIINLANGFKRIYESADQFCFSENEDVLASIRNNKLIVHSDKTLTIILPNNFLYARDIKYSSANNIVSIINKKNLYTFSTLDGKLVSHNILEDKLSYRDLKIIDNYIFAGVHYKDENYSKGVLKVYDISGKELLNKVLAEKNIALSSNTKLDKNLAPEQISWPFAPFDSMRTVWNHYEQHMGYYLHQGLDLIVPIAEPTYSVVPGYVKLVLTIGGESYWRLAVSKEQVPGVANGWLHAHLIQSTIQVDVGDTVSLHEYLGDIIHWAYDWAHIHFVEIKDSGSVWYYDDNEWGINFNPLNALVPNTDPYPPEIQPAFPSNGFPLTFAKNNSANILSKDSLYGDIDIIVKVNDYVGESSWSQPAYKSYYTIKRADNDSIVKPRTLGHILNHPYSFYDSPHFYPYDSVLYLDHPSFLPTSWMDSLRHYYHIITNEDGDTTISEEDTYNSLHTTNFVDGNYKIFVEVFDQYGNSDTASMIVRFKNGIVSVNNELGKYDFYLGQNYPNPFNPNTNIEFSVLTGGITTIKVYDILGEEKATILNEYKPAGSYMTSFDASNLSSGVYIYTIKSGNFKQSKKMLLMK